MQRKLIGLAVIAAYSVVFAAWAQAQSDNVADEPSKQGDDSKLVFSSLELDQTNRGTININGYDRHFSVTFPASYNNEDAYPVVLFFHGCMCRPDFTEESPRCRKRWSSRNVALA